MKLHNNIKDETKRQLEELENLVEKRTRTQRHLENCDDIVSPEQREHAEEIQSQRSEQIESIKNNIANVSPEEQERENIRDNYVSAAAYLEDNASHMSEEMIENMKEKQEHRKEALNHYQG